MKKLFPYLKPNLFPMAMQFVVKFFATITELFLPMILSYMIDTIVPGGDVSKVVLWGLVMIVCAGMASGTNIIANRMAIKTSREIIRKLRHDLFEKISYLSCKEIDRFTLPTLISRLTSDTYNVHQMIDRMQRLGIRAPILLVGGLITAFTMEPVLTLIMVAILPILGWITFTIALKGVPLYHEVQLSLDKLVRKVQENMSGVRVIKALSKVDYEKEKFKDINSEVSQNEQKADTTMAVISPSMNLLLNIGLTLVIVIGAYRVNLGLTQVGKIIAFLSYFTIIMYSILMITRLFVTYSKGIASTYRICEVLESNDNLIVGKEEHVASENFIEFRHVDFSYNKIKNNVSDISFALKKGETLGIIGPTGSGKSTIVNLLLRLYDVDRGDILIKGQKIATIPFERLHHMFGVVFQNDFIYADTIRENIDFGRNLADGALEEAIHSAQASFIAHKDGALDYVLAVKGANLSGGQKQRILISRALAAKPEILILDDSSSALDYKTDAQLRKTLHTSYRMTTIIVAQRISSIMNADRILVLDEGRIIGHGTHEELLQSCSSYREIYQIQMSGIDAPFKNETNLEVAR